MLLIVVISIVTNIILFYYLYFFLFIVTTIYYYYKQGTWLQKIFKIYFLYIFIYFFKLYYVIPHFYSPPKTEVCSSSSFLPLSSATPDSLPPPLCAAISPFRFSYSDSGRTSQQEPQQLPPSAFTLLG